MEAVVDRAEVLLDDIAALRTEIAQREALIAAKMLEFEDLRDAENASEHPNWRSQAHDAVRDELSLALVEPVGRVYDRLSQTRIVRDRLPETWEAFTEGTIDAYRVGLIGAAANKLSDNNFHFIYLDYKLAAFAATHTGSQLRSKLKRFVARIEPDRAATRARAERDRRHVTIYQADDGMAWLNAYLPASEALRIHQLLTGRAKTQSADGRTFDAIVADEFVDQLLTAPDGTRVGGAIIGVTIPAVSLAGLSEEPGESFDGEWQLPADLVRELAAEPGTLFHRIITDPAGGILDITELGRFPSAKLRIGIQIRDGNCQFPTCSRPAANCDLDHQVPHPRGPTSAENLGALCRRHHNLKTTGILNPYTASIRDAA